MAALFAGEDIGGWTADGVERVLDLSLLDVPGALPGAIFGDEPPEQGWLPYLVAVAAQEADRWTSEGPVRGSARHLAEALAGEDAAETLFDHLLDPAIAPAVGEVRCLTHGSVSAWVVCSTAPLA